MNSRLFNMDMTIESILLRYHVGQIVNLRPIGNRPPRSVSQSTGTATRCFHSVMTMRVAESDEKQLGQICPTRRVRRWMRKWIISGFSLGSESPTT